MISNATIVEGMFSIHKDKFPSRHGRILANIHEAKPGMPWPAIKQMIDAIPQLHEGKTLVLSGPVGNGKTLASYIGALLYEWQLKVKAQYYKLLNDLQEGDDQEFIEHEIFEGTDEQQAYRLAMKKYANYYGYTLRFFIINAPDWIKDAARTDSRPVSRTKKLIVMDDVGVEYCKVESGFALAEWDSFFKTRYANDLPTIVTTNLTMDDFKQRYDVRIFDRLKECADWITINEKSLRKSREAR